MKVSVIESADDWYQPCCHKINDQKCALKGHLATTDLWARIALFATFYMVGQKKNVSSPKNNSAAGCEHPVKIELLKVAGLLDLWINCDPK